MADSVLKCLPVPTHLYSPTCTHPLVQPTCPRPLVQPTCPHPLVPTHLSPPTLPTVFCIVMIRFRYISHHFDYKVLKVLNYLSLISGVSSAVGMIVVGSFQTTLVFPVHMAGAIVAFGGGLVFAGFNTAITFVLVRRNRDSKHRLVIQILLVILGILCFVLG